MQTLVALPALSAPVVPTNRTTLFADITALDDLSRADLLTVAILGAVHSVTATVDYRLNHPQLIQDASVLFAGMSNLDLNGASRQGLALLAVFAWNAGYSNDVTIGTDVNAILLEGRDLRTLPEETLARILLRLFYTL